VAGWALQPAQHPHPVMGRKGPRRRPIPSAAACPVRSIC